MKIAILGFGVEGKSMEKFLRSSLRRRTSKCEIEIRDIKKQGKDYLKNLENFEMIVRSPGIPYLRPEIQQARKQGVKITSATNLFFENIRGKIIGITGTKGKGTVATLLYKILQASGEDVYLVGNIGRPALDILPKLRKNSIIIYELSSFQLQDLNRAPSIAVILDISPDHLDYHKNFNEYLNAKSNIAVLQKKNDKAFYFAGSGHAADIAEKSSGKKFKIMPENFKLFTPSDLKIPGAHNFRNAVMAASIALNLGCGRTAILKTIKNFQGLKYHLEFIRSLKKVKYYNDSASTNPASTIAAIKSFKEPTILILGGKDKGFNYGTLAKAILKSNVKSVLLIGENKNKIKKALGEKLPTKLFKDLKSAVFCAKKTARDGFVVLFSPGAASFDIFKNAKERGKRFTKLIKSL